MRPNGPKLHGSGSCLFFVSGPSFALRYVKFAGGDTRLAEWLRGYYPPGSVRRSAAGSPLAIGSARHDCLSARWCAPLGGGPAVCRKVRAVRVLARGAACAPRSLPAQTFVLFGFRLDALAGSRAARVEVCAALRDVRCWRRGARGVTSGVWCTTSSSWRKAWVLRPQACRL